MLGSLLQGGALGKEAQPLALRYFALGSFYGNGDASLRMAEYYFQGELVPQNAQKSFSLIMRASEQGSGDASLTLGKMTQSGKFIPPSGDPARIAAAFFARGAGEDHPGCMRELAACYKKGLGVEKNETRAKELIRSAKELERAMGGKGGGLGGKVKGLFSR